ncbi:MAG: NAD-dependent epimerase/dehydratase family protein, partial [Planctomycetes bacterium]|nr:NAD-dependent epimerase/dehydratase family protein [Planctomycetota bacterium]
SKLASELLAREYSNAFGFPVWIDRCGLMAGAGQFGKADQGIVAYWLHRYLHRGKLKMIGFGGFGHQVRDCLHPRDLWELIERQIAVGTDASKPIVCNASGGIESSFSLAELTRWCEIRWRKQGGGAISVRGVAIERDPSTRLFDCPWIVLDSSLARHSWDWCPRIGLQEILNEVGDHAESHPEWLELSGE